MKRKLKLSFQITVAILIVVLLAMLVTGCLILFRGMGAQHTFTYLIVLGTTVEGTEPSPMLQDRITAAAKYMQAHPDVIAIATGGKADETNISEAECMFNGLVALGIDPSRIRMEDKATSTAENFEFSLKLLEEELGRVPRNVGVLSSEFHLLRAKMIAESYDIRVSTVAAGTSDMETFFRYFVREIFMVWFDGIKVALK